MENKTGKYFKYAIGEIILVVIGILIALQINTWNEDRKNNIKQTQFLKSFKTDLLANKLELERVIKKAAYTSKSSDSILMMQRGELGTFGLVDFVGFMMDATGFTVFQTQEGTIQDIMGSGNLDIITNDSIRLAIGSWHSKLKDIREFEELDKNSYARYNEYLHKHIKKYTRGQKELPINATKMQELLTDDLFLNSIADRKRFPEILNNRYSELIPKLDALIVKIDEELEN